MPPSSQSLPAPPTSKLPPALPSNLLSSSLPMPPMLELPVSVRFSTWLLKVWLTLDSTVSIPAPLVSLITSPALSTV
ncbi:hypothetical protein D3C84_993460 [compost metagenome]